MKVIVLDHSNEQAIIEALRLASNGKVLICVDSTIIKHMISQYEIDINLIQPIDESFYEYNYHNQFREFGVSKKDMFKTIRIRRKR